MQDKIASPSPDLTTRFKSINWLFQLTVVIPTLLSIIYFGFIASDVYTSESQFIVRSPDTHSASPFGDLLKGTGFSSSHDDSYTVQNYILSRDALKLLDDKLAIGNAYSSKEVDIFSRFAGLIWWENSFESLFVYYLKQVSIRVDASSSITTLSIQSFKAEDAYRINEQLIEMSEELVNQLNDIGQKDMIRFAANEVENAEKKAKTAALALSTFRNQKSVIDPEQQAVIELGQIVKLQDELIAAQAQMSQLQSFAKNNPQIPSLQLRIKNLKQEIDIQTSQIVGGDNSLAKKAAQYQRLALDREFAEKQLGSALASLEMARNEAQRTQLYLERVVKPSKPDGAMGPQRIRGVFSTAVIGLILWGVFTLLIAGIKEHQD
jgi:capsular polysaccharide transport system permease protein